MDKKASTIILQARTASTRLPGKVLMEVQGKSLLEHQMLRVERSDVNRFWLATTRDSSDDEIVRIAKKRGWAIYRGSPTDVLSRFTDILMRDDSQFFFRLTGDNPLTSPEILNAMLGESDSLNSEKYSLRDTQNIRLPLGLVPELLVKEYFLNGVDNLRKKEGYHREHVTAHVVEGGHWREPLFLRNFPVLAKPVRLTVDYLKDYRAVSFVLRELGHADDGCVEDILRVVSGDEFQSIGNFSLLQRSHLHSDF